MTDERIENELRVWLSDEASRIATPHDLRERVAAARTIPAARGWGARWNLALTRPLLAAVAGVVVVATGASLLVSGVLPVGRADCSQVSVDNVRAAADAVPGYTYRMSGSELQARPVPRGEGEGLELEYGTSTFAFHGEYRAPADWSIEITDFQDSGMPVPPTVGLFLLSNEWDGYLLVDGRGWVRPVGAERFMPLPIDGPDLTALGTNRLTDLLAGEPFRVAFDGNPTYELPLSWTVEAEQNGCRLISTREAFGPSADGSWTLELIVDPLTNLPMTATYQLATPEVPTGDDGSFASAQDRRYDFTFDYSDVPEIAPPANADVRPVTEDQVRNSAPQEIGQISAVVDDAIGDTQVFVVRGSDGIAVMRFEEARLADSWTVAEAEDIFVQMVESEDRSARFLVVIVNDVRIERVQVTYTRGETDEPLTEQLTTGGTRPIFIARVDHPGEIAEWRALDENGREVVGSEAS